MNGRKQGEGRPANEDVVEVSDNKVTVLLLGISRSRGMHDARETAHHEHPDEAEGEHHGHAGDNPPTPEGPDPVEYFYAGRHRDRHRR